LKASQEKMNNEYAPLETAQRALSQWWLIVILMLAGAGAGRLAFSLRTPIYKAEATIATSVDFVRTGQLEDIELDQLMGMTEDVITSPETFAAAASAAQAQCIPIDGPGLRKIAMTDRSHYEWTLRVIYPDAQAAAVMANLWAEKSYQALSEAYLHAVKAEGLLRYLDSLESCLQQAVITQPEQAYCNPGNLQGIQAELGRAGVEAEKERLASRGISTAITFSQGKTALVNPNPVQNGLNAMMLAGAGIGLLAAAWLISADAAGRLLRWRKRD
jgi:hypothetical protein